MANDKNSIAEQALRALPLDNMIGGPLAAAAEAQAAAARAQAEFMAALAAKARAGEPSEPEADA